MPEINCRHFTGYKPCGLFETCDSLCPKLDIPEKRILVVHLEALGAVLRSTSLLRAIKRKFPSSHITWVTQKPADELLKNNPFIDRILTTHLNDILALSTLKFDVAFNIDKSLKAYGVIKQCSVKEVVGFKIEESSGAIVPTHKFSEELWSLGLSDHKKFFVNNKPETQLTCEALGLEFKRDEYVFEFTRNEKKLLEERKKKYREKFNLVLGINTGCSNTLPAKKWTVNYIRDLVDQLLKLNLQIVLLGGGEEDHLRNIQIANGKNIISSDCLTGIRDGMVSVAACDIILSGDSLGMHMAIAMQKWVVAWFGPSCSHEIDLFDRGVKINTLASCSPCWKNHCEKMTSDKASMCFDLVPIESVIDATRKGVTWFQKTSSFKQHFLETPY